MSFYYNNELIREVYYNNQKVNEVYYNNELVFPDWYNITGTLVTDKHTIISNCEHSDDCNNHSENCGYHYDCTSSEEKIVYHFTIKFGGQINFFPVKYTSKSGALVTIAQDKLKLENGIYTYTFADTSNLDDIKSWYPATGVIAYCLVKSINITESTTNTSEETTDCNCSDNCNCGGNCSDNCNYDCQGDNDCGDCDCGDCDCEGGDCGGDD